MLICTQLSNKSFALSKMLVNVHMNWMEFRILSINPWINLPLHTHEKKENGIYDPENWVLEVFNGHLWYVFFIIWKSLEINDC